MKHVVVDCGISGAVFAVFPAVFLIKMMSEMFHFSLQGDLHHWLKHHWWWCESSTNQNQEFGQVGLHSLGL